MTYNVKEIFYTLQGEGAQAGRPAVFCRFSKCNLWNGREADRATAICDFCDTDFVGTDGQNGGQFKEVTVLVERINSLWPVNAGGKPFVVCTGGEPLLQLDKALIEALHQAGFEVAVETNGTLPAPEGIDWLCVSPKADAPVVITACDELKLVYPQVKAMPERFEQMSAQYFFLSPKADPQVDYAVEAYSERELLATDATPKDTQRENNTRAVIDYCLAHPQWRMTLQTHKLVGID